MGWYSDLIKNTVGNTNTIGKFLSSDAVSGLAQGAVGNAVSDYFQPDVPKIGYQGTVPELTAVRERVPMQQPVAGAAPRRPGSSGRRYFSDTTFAARPDTNVPTVAEAQTAAAAQAQQLAQRNQQVQGMAAGGIASAHNGYYLGGTTDGMADEVPASIDGTQEARLSDGEFVIPADVVSHLGNGNSDAGAQQLHGMMDGVRTARTGNSEQGKQIDPNKFMPKMAQGGIASYNYGGSVQNSVQKFKAGSTDPVTTTNNTTATTGTAGVGSTAQTPATGINNPVGFENSLSNWAGDYVTDMLGQGKALGNQAYQGYEGPLSAGASNLQQQAMTGVGSLNTPANMGAYTPQTFGAEQATQYMNPYLMSSLNPQIAEARRQNEIDRVANAGRMTQAGAFGGSRQALMDMEGQRNLQSNIADITGQGYASAYDRAQQQFNTEQNMGMQAQAAANQYGFDVLGQQQGLGQLQRGIESEGMAADYSQFQEERDYPYKQVQYMQSLLQGLPVASQTKSYSAPSDASQAANAMQGVQEMYTKLFGGS